MKLTKEKKDRLKQEIRENLSRESEIRKIVVFGSFINSENPEDIDIAIFQDSEESYLSLVMKYRKLTRKIARKIPLDIIPIKPGISDNWFLSEIETGEMIYER
ncbi:MAG: nucleotidyltransferase domain-containing protein [Candidatus Marinimicrobia bacterium]|nr:nucleotidyltransferase domain-containing protein [Candidatus Neomarinimicrobiota bacterium]